MLTVGRAMHMMGKGYMGSLYAFSNLLWPKIALKIVFKNANVQ